MNQQQTSQGSDTSTSQDERQPRGGSFDQLARELAEIGRVWAHYGLTVASRSLATSAQTIDLAAGSLERLSRSMAPEGAQSAGAEGSQPEGSDEVVIVDEQAEGSSSDA
jgi:hypothetical protein